LPAWERVRLAEIKIREKELEVRREEAQQVGRLSEIFNTQATATEELKIFLRAAMRQHDLTEQRLMVIEDKVAQIAATGMHQR
jgi:hypothetical protein